MECLGKGLTPLIEPRVIAMVPMVCMLLVVHPRSGRSGFAAGVEGVPRRQNTVKEHLL